MRHVFFIYMCVCVLNLQQSLCFIYLVAAIWKYFLNKRCSGPHRLSALAPPPGFRLGRHVVWTLISATCLPELGTGCLWCHSDASMCCPLVLKLWSVGLAIIILAIVLKFCVFICTYVYCADVVLTCIEGHMVARIVVKLNVFTLSK